MDNTEIKENVNDFHSLFNSDGLFKDKLEDYDKNQKEFNSLNEKAKEVKKEILELKNEVKVWVQRKSQLENAKKAVNKEYSSDVPPKDQDYKYYQEKYAIAQEFISSWSDCIDDMQDCQKKCDELEEFFQESTQKNKDIIKETLDQLTKLNLSNGLLYSYFYKCFKLFICCNFGFFSKSNTMIQLENIFNEFRNNLDRYQEDITASKDKVREYVKFLQKTVLQVNRVRMGRAPAYSKQAQNCSLCNGQYVFIKWCKFCDREQFQKQFSSWETDSSEFDKVIRDSQLSIKYPNVYIQWIPYEKFSNIEFVGKGAFAKVYKADWIEGIGVWDYALGKRTQYPNTPVALKELNKSANISKSFLGESSSSTVLRCYGISRNPESKEYVMVFPYAHGGDLRNYLKKKLNWINKLDILRHILFGLPLPDTVNQFITSNSKKSDEKYTFNKDQFASKLITIKATKDYVHKDDKAVDTNSVDSGDNNDEYQFDLMCDYSEKKIASIVTNKIPQLEVNEIRTENKPTNIERNSNTYEEKKLTTNEETNPTSN
ncbi:10178_t:CDS:2 [Dentiscutata erythropus]|uniref:10178_t:CDS:1 n=1 Tax=Dentiscutata erythropus TaxID=1348616 RepID=A0A9N9BC61_9GLOM|nr:10178_t:CDS:2 [Dentiscutata erythropus]